ncbi:hypothetical protein QN374_12925, partial [Herbaspirillum sp. RTI4]
VASGGSMAGVGEAMTVDVNNRQLHQSDIDNAKKLAEKAKKKGLPYTEQEIKDALQRAGIKDEKGNIKILPDTREIYVNGQPLPNGSGTLSLADNQKQNAPFAVDKQDGPVYLERLPKAPSKELADFISANSPQYVFDMPKATSSTRPYNSQNATCATAECATG